MGRGVRHLRGGIRSLHRLLTEHGEAIRADYLRGDLARLPETWHDARALFRYPRPGSALEAALDPDAEITPDTMLLRDLAFMVGRFLFNASEPVPLTQAERDAVEAKKPPKADLMTPADALARLGLTVRKEVSDG